MKRLAISLNFSVNVPSKTDTEWVTCKIENGRIVVVDQKGEVLGKIEEFMSEVWSEDELENY